MYRYARETRTLRAVAALLALHAVELADPCIKPPEALLLSPQTPHWSSLSLLCPCHCLHLGGGARLCACQAFVSPRRRLPLASAFACEQCVVKVRVAWTKGGGPRRRLEVAAASRDGLPAGLPAGRRDIAISHKAPRGREVCLVHKYT